MDVSRGSGSVEDAAQGQGSLAAGLSSVLRGVGLLIYIFIPPPAPSFASSNHPLSQPGAAGTQQ